MSRRVSTLALLAGLLAAFRAEAGPLEDTLALVYAESPRLAAGRAALRAADEGVPLALAGERPSATMRSSVGLDAETSSRGSGLLAPKRQSLDVTQPLYSGGATRAAVAQADGQVLAERARLVALEQAVLLDAVTAYVGVARDQAVLARAKENEKRLTAQLAATRDRLRFGDASRTDLAQAEARQAGAVAERIAAEGALASSSADYLHLVGREPGNLELPEAPAAETARLEGLLDQAENAPAYQAARHDLEAAEAGVGVARAAFRPRLALTGELSYAAEESELISSQSDAQVGATLQLPLYQGGAEYARLRQSKELRAQRQEALDEARRAAAAEVSAAYHDERTVAARLHSLQVQADAAAYALDGVAQEARVGARSVIDVLDAEAELFRDEVELVRAQAARVVAAYRLRAATGRLTAADLGLAVPAYDPTAHYRSVRNRWFGIGVVEPVR